MASDTGELLLCCLPWARDGEAAGLTAYEDEVLALIPGHGGEVLQRAQSDGVDGSPHEVQVYRFDSQAALDSYLADPRRSARLDERDRVIERTELFPVTFL